ncbi:hypothetical protein [Streptomyces sp. JJ38]|uniref:hypothetical protein n=1 Tax=Streptomyces sp. JJ38 TaxID=2738128 RepID=UPI001C5A2DDC|nr:hypothetical protein [Streptomyces sp. JJ38]MBW1598344.1 hypothetical protein [Streptomyces sp. JJ38]
MPGGIRDLGIQGSETKSQGTRLDDSADELDDIRKSLSEGLALTPFGAGWFPFHDRTYGEYGADPAFGPFARAWNAEIATLAGALREIDDKIGTGVSSMTVTEVGIEHSMSTLRSPLRDL